MKKNLDSTIAIYEAGDKEIEVFLKKESIWLDAHQIAYLLDVDRTVIVKHIQNIYKSLELSEKLTCAKIVQVAADGKKRKINLYNLDMIISVGYRVNSKKATQFRIWATNILKNYLVKGYAINEKTITREKFDDKNLYWSFKEKASNLLYLIIKNHQYFNGTFLSRCGKSTSAKRDYDQSYNAND